MHDSFLYAHQLGPRFYSVGGKVFPVSIRDQMLRGRMLVDRAFETGIIEKNGKYKLLIVGAGAAGLSAAVRAVELGVPALLLEKQNQDPCWVQAGCTTRWISPTAFDFPAGHWTQGVYPFPLSRSKLPLSWAADWAHNLVPIWRQAFNRALGSGHNLLKFTKNSTIDGTPDNTHSPDFVRVKVVEFDPKTAQPTSTSNEDVAGVFLATGFGKERCYLRPPGHPPGPARGFVFWERDPYGEADFGMIPPKPCSVLISGSGDGALQDLQRVLLDPAKCRTSQEFYDAIFNPHPLDTEFLRRLHCAQDWAQRALNWGHHNKHDHGVLERLHQIHLGVIRDLIKPPIGGQILTRVGNMLRDPLPRVHLVYECSHFSICYGLNRFLALLLLEFLERKRVRQFKQYPSHRLSTIHGVGGHVCSGISANCHGQTHDVQCEKISDCAEATPVRGSKFSIQANVLILRNGIDLSDLASDPTPPQARQTLPYGLV